MKTWFAVGVALLGLAPAAALAQSTYTWNRTTSASWTTSSNWTPQRSFPSSSDILVINGTTTPTATITSVPTQTIGRLRVINNANATLSASGTVTLTITGGAAPNFEIQSGSSMTLAGSTGFPISLNLTGSATGSIAGSLTFTNNAHRLLAATANAVQFLPGGSFTAGTSFSGNAFGSSGTANVIVFQSRSTYTHIAGSNPFGLTAPSSRVVFQTGSTAIIRSSTNFSGDGRTYANLTLQNNTAISSTGTNNMQIDTLTVEAGSSFSRVSSSASTLTIRGNISAAGTGAVTLTAGTGGLQFNGGVVQTIGGGGTGTVTLGSSGAVSATTTLALSRTVNVSAGTLTVNGTLRLDPGGVTTGNNLAYGAGATLAFANTSLVTVASTSPYWPSASGPTNVTISGAGGVTMGSGATRTVSGTIQTAAALSGANLLTVNGTLRLNSGGSVSGAPTYGSAATLLYATGFTVGAEWGAGSTAGSGVPFHVAVDAGAGTVSLPSSNRTVPGNLTITSGTLALNATSGDLSVGGNWNNAGTFTPNGRIVTFTGSGTQTLTRAAGETFATLALAKSGGSLQILSAVTCSPGASGVAVRFGGTTDVLDLNGRVLTVNGRVTGPNTAGSLRGSTSSGLVLAGALAADTVRFTSTFEQLGTLTVNRTLGGSGVVLGTNLTVSTTLTLTSGVVSTGANTLALGASATVGRTSGWVNGILQKSVATGSPTLAYEVGSAAAYTPLSLTFTNVTVGGNVSARATASEHPSVATSGIDGTKSVNRYFTLAGTGLTFTSYSATLNFVAGDVDGGAVPDSFEVRRFTGGTWSLVPTGTRTATSTQGTGLGAFGDLAIGEPRLHTITATAGANGTISPIGAVQVKNGRPFTFTMIPDAGYEVGDVLVNGGSVGAVTSYTFLGVVADGTISVSFTIATYPVTVQIVGEGTVTRDQPGPEYPYGTILYLQATPALGSEFDGWSDDVFTQFNPITFRVDSAMNVVATFRRVPLQYVRSAFTATYSPISVGTGASRLFVAADDSTQSIPLPFPFTFSGIPFTTGNFLAVNANGFAHFSRASVTASNPSLANNANLHTVSAPNSVLAPWYDDLAVGAVGTNPAGSVLYQTQGAAGSRTLTVQWTNVSSYNNTSGGQPRRLNFQLVLYEFSQSFEFRYGTASGSTYSNLESAAIGVEDSLGGGGNFIDGVSGSRVTSHGMMTSNKWPTRFLRFFPGAATPLPGGTYTVGAGGNYPNLSEAVADLNQRGVSGPVTMRLTDAVYDSSAANGGNVFPILVGPVGGVSASNPLAIESQTTATLRYRGTDAGTCGNASVANVITTSNEPILALLGTDHMTLQNLVFEGGNLVDRGVLLLPASISDGAWNNTLHTLRVTLNRGNTSSIGVQQSVPTTPTGPSGSNSFNTYLNLRVENAYAGVSLAGNATYLDSGNQMGVSGGSSVIGGPITGDIGNGTASTFGVRATNQSDLRIEFIEVRSVTGTGTGTVDGIAVDNLSSSAASSGTCVITACSVHDLNGTSTNAGRVAGIRVNLTSEAASQSRVYNNFVFNLNSRSTVTSPRRVVGILAQDAANGVGATHNIDFNSVRLAPSDVLCSNTCFEIGTATGPVVNVRNNIFANFTGPQSGAAKHYAWVTPAATATGAAGSVSDRNILHIGIPTNGHVGLAAGVDKSTLASWQAVAATDGLSSVADPQFLGSGNLHINAALPTPVESAGSFFDGAIPWVDKDTDNQARNATTPDIGADEGAFQLLTQTDAGVQAFVDPTDGATKSAGVSFSPQAQYGNLGTFGLTNVTARYRILGPLPDSTVLYDESIVIASLAPGVSQSVTFPATSIAIGGYYSIRATAIVAGDQNPVNDHIVGALDVAGALSGTYLVGSGQPSPFNTLTNALNRLNSVGVIGPVQFHLVDALYSSAEVFPIQVNSIPGASATNTVTLRPAPGVTPTLSGNTARALLVLNGTDYLTVNGSNSGGTSRDLTLHNLSTNAASAVVWTQTGTGPDPATNNTFKNLVLSGSDNTATLFGAGFGGATISLASGGSGNLNNTVQNCLVKRVQYGIYSAGLAAGTKSSGTIVTENEINGTGADAAGKGGIFLRFEDSPQVTKNRIGNIASGADHAVFGISLGVSTISSATWAGDEVTNALVGGNLIRGVTSTHPVGYSAAGIVVAEAATGTNRIVNNMVSGVFSPAADPDVTVGIMVGGGAGTTQVYFNSVALSGFRAGATAPSFCFAAGGTNSIIDLRNNAFWNSQLSDDIGDGYVIGIHNGPPYSNLTSNYNLFYSTAASFAVYGGLTNTPDGDLVNLLAWRGETGKDANSVSAAPLFVSANDLHIGQSGSPLANAGQVIAGITTDIDGEPGLRGTTPDIGADEFITYQVNLTTIGTGQVARFPDVLDFISGSVVQLTANAGSQHHFVDWTGDIVSRDNPLSFVIDGPKNLTVKFGLDSFTVSAVSGGNGTVTRTPDQAAYPYGTPLSLGAAADTGYHFVNWTGDTISAANPLGLTVTQNRGLVGNFAINQYTVNTSASGPGSVVRSPDQTAYDHFTPLTLTAVPDVGFVFAGWTGDTTALDNPLSLTVKSDRTLVANFALALYTLSVNSSGNGTAAKSPDQPTHAHGSTVTVTATPDPAYHFVSWSGDTTSTDNPLSFSIVGDRTLTANFAINTYGVTATADGEGTVTRTPDLALYDHGSTVELTATPLPGHTFLGWDGDTSGTANPLAIVVTRARSVTARFTYALNTSVIGTGTVTRNPDQTAYQPGSVAQLTAVPGTGQHFLGWSGDTTAAANPLNVGMTRTRSLTALFAPDSHAVNVAVVGNGSVARAPDEPLYPYGSTVQLSATPQPGHTFVGWAGDASGTDNPLNVGVNGPKNITARFTFDLAVTVSGSGSVTKSPDQTVYAPGSTVELTATPGPFFHFVNWTGDTTAASNPMTVPMNGNRTITANFAIDTHTLTATPGPNGAVSKDPDQPAYDHGAQVVVTATADTGYHFVSWSGDTTTTTNPLTIPMTGDRTVQASFEINSYALELNVAGNGTLGRSPDLPFYTHGSTVQITATPDVGSFFLGWAGDASGNENPLTVVMDGPKNITGVFEFNEYTVDVTVDGSGSVQKSPDQPTYSYGDTLTLTAVANTGWFFEVWTGDVTGGANPVTIVVDGPKSIAAKFGATYHPVTLSSIGNGALYAEPAQAEYAYGSLVDLIPVADPGWHFVSYGGDASGSAQPYSLLVDGPKTVTATFEMNLYPLVLQAIGAGGTVTANPNLPAFPYGTLVEITATSDTAHHFVRWGGDADGRTGPIFVTMTESTYVSAYFESNLKNVDVQILGNGTVARTPNSPNAYLGSTYTLTATPGPGQAFIRWQGDLNTVFNPISFPVDSDMVAVAVFEVSAGDPSVNVQVFGSGSVAKSPDQPTYPVNSSITLTATASPGWHFHRWGGDIETFANPVAFIVDNTKDIEAYFVPDNYALVTTVVGSGSIARNPAGAIFPPGTPVELTATADPGFHFLGWSGDTTASGNPITVYVNRDRAVTAVFGHIVTTPAVQGGHVAVSPAQPVHAPGATATLTPVPEPGWHFVSWGGDASGIAVPYGLLMDADKTVTATFELGAHNLEVLAPVGGTVARSPDLAAYTFGTTVVLSAEPQSGWHFTGWRFEDYDGLRRNQPQAPVACEVCAHSQDNPLSVVMEGDRTVLAMFEENPGGFAPQIDGMGTVVEKWQAQPGVDETVELHAEPEEGWRFVGWRGDIETASETVVAHVTGPTSVVAVFERIDGAGATASLPAPRVTSFALDPVVPNPTTGPARVDYALPHDAVVRLSVHDVQGRTVAVLAEGAVPAGRHSVVWSPGRANTAGIYFVRFQTPRGILVRRVAVGG